MSVPTGSPQADVFAAVKAMVVDLHNKANAIVSNVQDQRVDVKKFVHDIRKDENVTDDKVKAFQVRLAKMEQQMLKEQTEIDDYIKTTLVKKSGMSDEVYEAEKAKYTELKKQAKAAQTLSAQIPGYTEGVFADIPPLKTLAGGTAGATTGIARPRLSFLSIAEVKDGKVGTAVECFVMKKAKDGTESKSYTFTNAASVLAKQAKGKVSPSDLSAAALKEAKTDNLSSVTSVEFGYSVNGSTYILVAIPSSGKEDEKKEEVAK